MSTDDATPASPLDNNERLPSLAALQASHKKLLLAHRQVGDTREMLDQIKAFIHQGQASGSALDAEADRWTAQGVLDYWSATLFRVAQQAPDATLADFDPDLAPEIPEALCPYVGLDPFGEAQQDVFFGRERMVASLLERLRAERLLVVAGPSGCGKSSIVMAGLLPVLKDGALPGSQGWRYAPRMVPGSNPLANLLRVMLTMAAEGISDPVAWAREQEAQLRQNPWQLSELANRLKTAPIVGVIDQFEEVFTLCNDGGTRRAFLDNLAQLVLTPGAAHRIILTMRTDFEPFVARFPEFQALFEPAVVRVTPLSAAELRDAIEKPAQKVGLKFEAGLIDQLLHDVLGEPAALPLLQFTLLKLWDHRARNRIIWQAYNRLGGGRLALARSADDFYDDLILEDQITAKRIFLRLVRPAEGLEFTSNRVRVRTLFQAGEACDRVQRVLDKLIAARLVRVTEGDIAADAQIEVAHEALVRNWPRLVEWLEEERHTLRQRQGVADAAERWNVSGRDPGALYTTDTILAEALRVVEGSSIPLDEQETEFIQASRRVQEEAREAEETARQREIEQANRLAEVERQRADEAARAASRLKWLAAILFILVVGTVVAAVAIQGQRDIAMAAQGTAQVSQAKAESGATLEAVAKATAEKGGTLVALAKGTLEVGATQVAAARATAEKGATRVAGDMFAARTKEAQMNALVTLAAEANSAQLALVNQLSTAVADISTPTVKNLTPEESLRPTRTPTLRTATATLRPIVIITLAAAEGHPTSTRTATATATATRPTTPTPGSTSPTISAAAATAQALEIQRNQIIARQTEVACSALINGLSSALRVCSEINANWACYGAPTVNALPADVRFHEPEDRQPLERFEQILTDATGIVIITAALADYDLPVMLVAFDDSVVMLTTSKGTLTCTMLPPGLVIKSAEGGRTRVRVNNVTILLN